MTMYDSSKIIPIRKLRDLCALCGKIIVNLRKSYKFNSDMFKKTLHRYILALLAIILAFALSIYCLDTQSLVYDEGFSVYLARQSLSEITAHTAADIHPPLYYYLLHFWINLAGDSEFAIRFLSTIFGVLLVPLGYAAGKRLLSHHAGLVTAFIFVLSPARLWYSQEARMYTLVTALGLLSSYLLVRAVSLSRTSSPHPNPLPKGEREKTPLSFSGSTPTDRLRAGDGGALSLTITYALANICAVYTHFYAFFIVAFQFVYLVWCYAVRRYRERRYEEERRYGDNALESLLISNLLSLICYLPWFGFVVNRFGADVSYWAGTLDTLDVLRHTLIAFSVGHTVLEKIAQPLSIGYLLIFIAAFVIMVRTDATHFRSASHLSARAAPFLALYLIIPIVLLFLISYNRPKFHPRYLMVAYPAFVLIISIGLSLLRKIGSTRIYEVGQVSIPAVFAGDIERRLRKPPYAGTTIYNNLFHESESSQKTFAPPVSRWLINFALVYIITTSLYADYNLYFALPFTRPSFREAARYIERNSGADEAVILTSGHFFPVFTYYYRGDNWTPLPAEPTLSTETTLGFDIAPILNDALRGRRGVWLVLWQDEVVDPNEVLTTMIEQKGERVPITDVAFWHVKLQHYTLPPDVHFSAEPRIAHPANINFDDQITCLGYDQLPDHRVLVYWQAQQALAADYKVALHVTDRAGHDWGRLDRRPAGYYYPTTRWEPGEILFGKYEPALLPGAPPGEYELEISLYTDADPGGLDVLAPNGAPLGKIALLGTATLAGAPMTDTNTISDVMEITPYEMPRPITDNIEIISYDLSRASGQPGDRVDLTLFWRAAAPPTQNYTATLALIGEAANQQMDKLANLPIGEFAPANRLYPTSQWRAGEIIRGQYAWRVPLDAAAGTWELAIALTSRDATRYARSPTTITTFEVEETDRIFTSPRQLDRPSGANFADRAVLLGGNIASETVAAGEKLELTLFWQATAPMDIEYTMFVHILDAHNQVVAQRDAPPANGARPTTGWVPGEIITDHYAIPIPAETAPGEYFIEIGVYDAASPTFERLPILGDDGKIIADNVLLGSVKVR